jgi:hypothetical protein
MRYDSTLSSGYKINPHRLSDFEEYARNWPKPIERCGGKLIGYFLPTKFAGRTDSALALIDFQVWLHMKNIAAGLWRIRTQNEMWITPSDPDASW